MTKIQTVAQKAENPVNNRTTQNSVPLVKADTALISLRSSGHDHDSAVGEVIDNSLEADANNIRVWIFTEKKTIGNSKKATEVVERIAIGDDGKGMSENILHQALSLGFTTRFDSRKGMGRFGVGAKLGGISQAKRIDLYSRQAANQPWRRTHIDLDEIERGEMQVVPEPELAELPEDCKDLVGEGSGTLVIWSKTDRLQQRDTGGARQANTVISELTNYIARTFRKFLDAGRGIYINDKLIKPHDPLFLMTTTLFHEGSTPDPAARILTEEKFEWPVPKDPTRTSTVEVIMTLLPEEFRPHEGAGGEERAKKRRIDENEGISILRANREIFFGHLKGVQPPMGRWETALDRWIGVEIRFFPDLDECFAVRNVKKGAEPINGLRDKLRQIIYNTILTGRKLVRQHWVEEEAKRQAESGPHSEAEQLAAKVADVSPKPRAGLSVSEPERKEKIRKAAEKLAADKPDQVEKIEKVIQENPVTIIPEDFPGSELFEIEHLGTKALIRLNTRHPFYRKVYAKLLEQIEKEDPKSPNGETSLARLAQVGLDLLICGYAMAEGVHENPVEYYDNLRSHWGINVKNLVNKWEL